MENVQTPVYFGDLYFNWKVTRIFLMFYFINLTSFAPYVKNCLLQGIHIIFFKVDMENVQILLWLNLLLSQLVYQQLYSKCIHGHFVGGGLSHVSSNYLLSEGSTLLFPHSRPISY